MPLDLRTQKTLQAVARECAAEAAEEVPEPVVADPEPEGLLARLLKQRGEDGFGSGSADFFASFLSDPKVPSPAEPSSAAPAPEPAGAKGTPRAGAKRGAADSKPAGKKPRKK